MKKAPKRKSVLYIRNLPKDLKDQFKSECALRGRSMNTMIIRLIRNFVSKQKENVHEPSKHPKRIKDRNE